MKLGIFAAAARNTTFVWHFKNKVKYCTCRQYPSKINCWIYSLAV